MEWPDLFVLVILFFTCFVEDILNDILWERIDLGEEAADKTVLGLHAFIFFICNGIFSFEFIDLIQLDLVSLLSDYLEVLEYFVKVWFYCHTLTLLHFHVFLLSEESKLLFDRIVEILHRFLVLNLLLLFFNFIVFQSSEIEMSRALRIDESISITNFVARWLLIHGKSQSLLVTSLTS